jgi:hypothetical protein
MNKFDIMEYGSIYEIAKAPMPAYKGTVSREMLVQLMHRIMQLHLYFAPPSLFKFL